MNKPIFGEMRMVDKNQTPFWYAFLLGFFIGAIITGIYCNVIQWKFDHQIVEYLSRHGGQ